MTRISQHSEFHDRRVINWLTRRLENFFRSSSGIPARTITRADKLKRGRSRAGTHGFRSMRSKSANRNRGNPHGHCLGDRFSCPSCYLTFCPSEFVRFLFSAKNCRKKIIGKKISIPVYSNGTKFRLMRIFTFHNSRNKTEQRIVGNSKD